MFALNRATIFLTLAGSHAHGTARDGSDVDLRGICVAPMAVRLSLFETFEQAEGDLPPELEPLVLPRLRAHPTAASALDQKVECVIFDVAKFLTLCANANPNALEILFADPADWVVDTPAWRLLYEARAQFLTRKVQHTFLGYAMSQLKRIKTHRAWLLNPPTDKPTREQFGLPASQGTLSRDDRHRIEQSSADKLRRHGVDDLEMPKATRIALRDRITELTRDLLAADGATVSDEELDQHRWRAACASLNLPPTVIAALTAEKRYHAAMKQWDAYQSWLSHRNRARAQLEAAHGYDTKHAMHLIRLMRMGVEVLEHGDLRVRRPDATELAAIRDGALSYDALHTMATDLQQRMTIAAAQTQLPDDVDRAAVDRLALQLAMADVTTSKR